MFPEQPHSIGVDFPWPNLRLRGRMRVQAPAAIAKPKSSAPLRKQRVRAPVRRNVLYVPAGLRRVSNSNADCLPNRLLQRDVPNADTNSLPGNVRDLRQRHMRATERRDLLQLRRLQIQHLRERPVRGGRDN